MFEADDINVSIGREDFKWRGWFIFVRSGYRKLKTEGNEHSAEKGRSI